MNSSARLGYFPLTKLSKHLREEKSCLLPSVETTKKHLLPWKLPCLSTCHIELPMLSIGNTQVIKCINYLLKHGGNFPIRLRKLMLSTKENNLTKLSKQKRAIPLGLEMGIQIYHILYPIKVLTLDFI